MINILVCDDDNIIINRLITMLDRFKMRSKIAISVIIKNSADSVISENISCDIAVLDIEMPGTGGLKLAEHLKRKNNNVLIIILTSFMEYLDNAMRINVFRYLSKPIEQNRFYLSLSDAIDCYQNIGKYIIINSDGELFKIRTNCILYIENLKHGSKIITKDSEYITNKKPHQWLNEINQTNCFVYSHKSYIVNLQNIINLSKNYIVFETKKGTEPFYIVSQRKYGALKHAFYDFVGNLK